MPLLALILQILHITKKRYYIEHFILTLHNQAFLVFSIFLIWVLGYIEDLEIPWLSEGASWLEIFCMFWIVIYLFLSLKRFYGEGFILTPIKFIVISVTYSICMGIGMALFLLLLFIFS